MRREALRCMAAASRAGILRSPPAAPGAREQGDEACRLGRAFGLAKLRLRSWAASRTSYGATYIRRCDASWHSRACPATGVMARGLGGRSGTSAGAIISRERSKRNYYRPTATDALRRRLARYGSTIFAPPPPTGSLTRSLARCMYYFGTGCAFQSARETPLPTAPASLHSLLLHRAARTYPPLSLLSKLLQLPTSKQWWRARGSTDTHTHLKSLGMGIATGLMQNRREDGVRAKGPKGPQDRAPPRNLAARHNHKRQDLHRRSEAALLCGLLRLARRRVIKERRQRLAERSSRRPDPRPAAVVFVAGADTAAY
ncbi:hypothetical protein PCL_00389 [Purpureocillium lilacinum]|uniref:Uncharacterized protein n=1 Tax=Purpureocillium lilacinum TaxID=33203 RepID=A0A2U3E6U5_PURLI|nr:hypothetical protein PCL_00389 [Purpureocillium lilacinum]